MEKGIIVVDVPKSCTDCQLGNLNFYSVGKDNVYCQLNKKGISLIKKRIERDQIGAR